MTRPDVRQQGLPPPPNNERARDAPTRSGVEISNLRTNEKPRHPLRQRGKCREETPKEGNDPMHGACQDDVDPWVGNRECVPLPTERVTESTPRSRCDDVPEGAGLAAAGREKQLGDAARY